MNIYDQVKLVDNGCHGRRDILDRFCTDFFFMLKEDHSLLVKEIDYKYRKELSERLISNPYKEDRFLWYASVGSGDTVEKIVFWNTYDNTKTENMSFPKNKLKRLLAKIKACVSYCQGLLKERR